MDFSFACQVIDEMVACGAERCILIGGESTLYPRLIELIVLGQQKGLRLDLITNGRLLADLSFAEKLKTAGLEACSVSIEAASESVHDEVTQVNGSFRETLMGICNLKMVGIPFNTTMTISSANSNQIVPLARLMHKMGVKHIYFNFGIPSVGENYQIDGSCCLIPRRYADLMVSAYKQLKEEGIRIHFLYNLPLCLIDQEVIDELIKTGTISKGYQCQVFTGTGVAIEPNGNVLPCTHFVNAPLYNARRKDGNFRYAHGNFQKDWEGGERRKLLESVWQYPIEACRSCDRWGICVGGCPFLWMYFDPEVHLKPRGVIL